MALHLVTGYAGREHITSADQGAYNMATYGAGNFVLERGRKFAATVVSNNSVSIADGEAMMQGRYIKMPSGTSEELVIDNGSQGKSRNDLICIRYEKNASDSVESTSLVVIKGTEATGTATDPTYNNGTITDGNDTIADFPLYRVKLNGINIETVTELFDVKTSMVDYMDNYQLPQAGETILGGIKLMNYTMKSGEVVIPARGTVSLSLSSPPIKGNGTRFVLCGSCCCYSKSGPDPHDIVSTFEKYYLNGISGTNTYTIEYSITLFNPTDTVKNLNSVEVKGAAILS